VYTPFPHLLCMIVVRWFFGANDTFGFEFYIFLRKECFLQRVFEKNLHFIGQFDIFRGKNCTLLYRFNCIKSCILSMLTEISSSFFRPLCTSVFPHLIPRKIHQPSADSNFRSNAFSRPFVSYLFLLICESIQRPGFFNSKFQSKIFVATLLRRKTPECPEAFSLEFRDYHGERSCILTWLFTSTAHAMSFAEDLQRHRQETWRVFPLVNPVEIPTRFTRSNNTHHGKIKTEWTRQPIDLALCPVCFPFEAAAIVYIFLFFSYSFRSLVKAPFLHVCSRQLSLFFFCGATLGF